MEQFVAASDATGCCVAIRAAASCSAGCGRLARGGHSGAEVAQRIVRAAAIAAADHDRAVTHNKGVLNGIAALTQATGNDTRAVEAAAHGWAAVGLHPVSRLALRMLGNPDSRRLAAIARRSQAGAEPGGAAGTGDQGVQHGHMRLHAERLAFDAGAPRSRPEALRLTVFGARR